MENGVNPDYLYNLENLADLLGFKKRTLQEALSRKELKGFKKHGRWFVLGKDLIEYLTKEG
ncbi:MAG: helix-turn-helix domain-containing protein [Bacteroidota bacterium]